MENIDLLESFKNLYEKYSSKDISLKFDKNIKSDEIKNIGNFSQNVYSTIKMNSGKTEKILEESFIRLINFFSNKNVIIKSIFFCQTQLQETEYQYYIKCEYLEYKSDKHFDWN